MYFQGTTADQDNRFTDKKKKLMKQMRFGDSLEKKVLAIFYSCVVSNISPITLGKKDFTVF